jgi:hypothetical protein
LKSEHQAIGAGHTDQWRTPHHHGSDRICCLITIRQGSGDQAMGQQGLIDHTNGALIGFKPNRPPSLAINVHGRINGTCRMASSIL